MRNPKKQSHVSRRQFLRVTTVATGGFLLIPGLSKAVKSLAGISLQNTLEVAVIGDSAMWGQGLSEEDKFSRKSVDAIGNLLGRKTNISKNLAHSGAAIRASEADKLKFLNTYPAKFKAIPGTKPTNTPEHAFLYENNQEISLLKHGEIPSIFPTVEYQVATIPNSVAKNIELVLVNGGANDLDFEEFLDPQEFRDNFVEHYDQKLQEIVYGRVKSLIRQVREKFPKAVIIYTGYFSPFAPGVSNSELNSLFVYLSKADIVERALNKVLKVVDVDQLVREAQYRSQFGLTRGLFWTRMAIAESNKDARIKGPGIIFVHPQFGPENTVFAKDSFFHPGYKVSTVNDPVKKEREDAIVRREHLDSMADLFGALIINSSSIKSKATNLLNVLDGPKDLLRALKGIRIRPGDHATQLVAKNSLAKEINRINHARIASFCHPNRDGANRYFEKIVQRYTDWHLKVDERLTNDLKKFKNAGSGSDSMRIHKVLNQYNLQFYTNLGLDSIAQTMEIDSIVIELRTVGAPHSKMLDTVYLDLGNNNRWPLNFPLTKFTSSNLRQKRILDPQFGLGKVDRFSIDGRGLHLSSITQLVIKREAADNVANPNGSWSFKDFKMFLNGIEVFHDRDGQSLTRNESASFLYPKLT